MTCGNCARHVTEAIQAVPGVRSAAVSLEQKNAAVLWQPAIEENPDAVVIAIKKAGYDAEIIENNAGHEPAKADWQWGLWLGVIVTLFLMVGEWVLRLNQTPWFPWLAFALAALVQIFSGAAFYRGAWRQLKTGSANMDLLVALGSTTAFGYSAWALLSGHGGHLYFMEAAAIISLISLGHYIEARVTEKAGSTLHSLMELTPQTARKVQRPGPKAQTPAPAPRPSNLITIKFSSSPPAPAPQEPAPQDSALSPPQAPIETEIPVSDLQLDDLVALRPGDRVPVDGIVVDGQSAVNESMLTGEAM